MYVHSLKLENLRCFKESSIELQYRGRTIPGSDEPSAAPGFENLNLLVGDNGSGKSTVLKAIVLAVLGGVLPHEGFRAYHLVRDKTKEASLRAEVVQGAERSKFEVKVVRRGTGETLHQWRHFHGRKTADEFPPDKWFEDSSEFFLCAYAASARRAEILENYDQALRDKSRGPRYQRVASMFDEVFSLRPISAVFRPLSSDKKGKASRHHDEAVHMLEALLEPTELRWTRGFYDGVMGFREKDRAMVPVEALSDGYRGFLAWTGDLISQLVQVAGQKTLGEIPGVVLIDEIDQHLHPRWQRTILSTISKVFPNLQFVATTHSPILVSGVPADNIYVCQKSITGVSEAFPVNEESRGKRIDRILLSEYFGLPTTLDPALEAESQELEQNRALLAEAYLSNPSEASGRAYLDALEQSP